MWANDKYLIAPGNDAARKKLMDLLLANPQDLTHADQILTPKPALTRLGEIKVPTLILLGDADHPDVHVHAGAIEAGIPCARRTIIPETGHITFGSPYEAGPAWGSGSVTFDVEDFNLDATLGVLRPRGYQVIFDQ